MSALYMLYTIYRISKGDTAHMVVYTKFRSSIHSNGCDDYLTPLPLELRGTATEKCTANPRTTATNMKL